MKKIAIIFAMQKELDLFAKKMTDLKSHKQNHLTFYCGQHQDLDLCLCVSGIGKVNAALCVANVMSFFQPNLIINIGVSGGLDPTLKIGDVVVADNLIYHDVWCGHPCQLGQVYDMPTHYTTIHADLLPEYKRGRLISGDWFMTEPEKLQKVKTTFPNALAVDMESAAIAQSCHHYQCPLMVIRQISDVVGTPHEQEILDKFWENAPKEATTLLLKILDKLADLG